MLVHGKKVLCCGLCFTALWGMHRLPGTLFAVKIFPVLSVKAMQQILCGADIASVLPMVFHCDCIQNILEGSVKGV